jgi:O-antigen/teichoic acid export membrane protein
MNTEEIIQKSLSGAKWTVILSIVAMPLGYIVNIILGRISPEALGIYGLLSIFILSVTTFILFGGGNVIIKYLPEIDKDKKVSFLISYILIVFLIAIFAIGLVYLYPQILETLFGQAFPLDILPYLIIFIPIIILYFVFDYALNGLMEIKTSVIIRQVIVYGNFIVFSILFLFYKDENYEFK